MKTTAAVLVELNRPLVLAELEIPPLKPGQVLVEVAVSGVCHTQVLEARGHRGEDKFLPHGLGHEGSGVVRETGPGVSKVRAGDKVILSWIRGSGQDVPSTRYDWNGRGVNSGAITTFSRLSVLSENRLTPLKVPLSMKQAALLGCAFPTGAGAVMNAAKLQPGQTAAVFGAGGVGLCAVIAARLAGCSRVWAVDVTAAKLEAARAFGATDVVDASRVDPVQEILKAVPSGLDAAIEASGRPAAMKQALACVRARGGTAVVIGNARAGEMLELDPRQFNQGKRLLGTWGGDSDPDRDYGRYAELLASGQANVEKLTGAVYALERINEALDDLERGAALRPLIDMSL